MKRLVLLLVLISTPVTANEVMQNWLKLDRVQRALWIAGSMDGFSAQVALSRPLLIPQLDECLKRHKHTNEVLADRVHAYINATPSSQNFTPGQVTLVYISKLCGIRLDQ